MTQSYLEAIIPATVEGRAGIIRAISEAYIDGLNRQKEENDKATTALRTELTNTQTKLTTTEGELATTKTALADEQTAHTATKEGATKEAELSAMDKAVATALKVAGLEDDIIPLLIDIGYDREAIKLAKDGTFTGMDKLVEGLKADERYKKRFGKIETSGTHVPSPTGTTITLNPFAEGEGFCLEKQAQLFRENPAAAREMAGAVGIILPSFSTDN